MTPIGLEEFFKRGLFPYWRFANSVVHNQRLYAHSRQRKVYIEFTEAGLEIE